MDAREETLTHLNRIWTKLQNLPNAHPVEQAAFCVLLTFICESRLVTTTLFSRGLNLSCLSRCSFAPLQSWS